MTPIKVDVRCSRIPVMVVGETGQIEEFELREMTAAARDEYLDLVRGRMKFDEEGKPVGLDKFTGLQSELLCRCLFRKGSDRPTNQDIIQKWPASTVTTLFEAAQQLNRLAPPAGASSSEGSALPKVS